MQLSPGDKLGPYECIALIGKGGMGEVWKAHDSRLKRDVAIKVSAAQFSERFEREAQSIAALNHPNICQLYDVGPNYLVMEYIEGAPLKGPLPIDQALKFAAQICDALDAAHKKGITHRDLKPANILVTKQGIKLLDFGLAKLNSAVAKPVNDATLSMALTGKNEIVGTLYYMSPEQLQAQANGQEIDARSDIFSFGLVLYEILTGKRAFEGSSPASVIAAIMERSAPSVATIAPPALDRLLQRCLAKDPDDRWQSARDLKAELEWIASAPEAASTAPSLSRLGSVGWIAAAVCLVAAGSLALIHFRQTPPAVPGVVRFQIPAPANTDFEPYMALSPDGRQLAFIASGRLWVRAVDSVESRALAGTENSIDPYWSPDSRFIAFASGNALKKVDASGSGPPQTVCEVTGTLGRGSWSRDGVIIFGGAGSGPLRRVSAEGGAVTPATAIDPKRQEISHAFPTFLPDGRHTSSP